MHRHEAQPRLLVGREALVKRLPGVGEPPQACRTVRQDIGSLAVALHRIAVTPLTHALSERGQSVVTRLGPGADRLFHGRP